MNDEGVVWERSTRAKANLCNSNFGSGNHLSKSESTVHSNGDRFQTIKTPNTKNRRYDEMCGQLHVRGLTQGVFHTFSHVPTTSTSLCKVILSQAGDTCQKMAAWIEISWLAS
eukprot:1136727-Pelagomonas_calceolata.AAC.3